MSDPDAVIDRLASDGALRVVGEEVELLQSVASSMDMKSG
jgi:hypothetical protein